MHSPDCPVRRLGWVTMGRLSPEERQLVLDCPDRSHASVRMIWRTYR